MDCEKSQQGSLIACQIVAILLLSLKMQHISHT